jgi:STELLO glycosyltransferases
MNTDAKFIVVTTIHRPSEAVQLFSRLSDYRMVVVGDRKTPPDWLCDNVDFLAVSAESNRFGLASLLPLDHYARKNIGYIYAIRAGAEAIVDTDDDNVPKRDWGFPAFDGIFDQSQPNMGFVNIYKSYTDMHIWPRGFPLDIITSNSNRLSPDLVVPTPANVGVWQGLVDGDPDVDAIYRLVLGKPCIFDFRPPIVLGKGTLCPFNSQNTIFRREIFPLLYLPATVSMRFTDILRALVAQPIMWASGFTLGFTSSTAVQVRNPHDYLDDFREEIGCYIHSYAALDAIVGVVRAENSVADNLTAAYEALSTVQIVNSKESKMVDQWLKDIGC